MSREERRAVRGEVSGAGSEAADEDVGSERVEKDAVSDRAGWRGAVRADVGGNDGAEGERVEGVTSVDRKAVRSAEVRTTTGTSSSMFVGTTLCSIRLVAS